MVDKKSKNTWGTFKRIFSYTKGIEIMFSIVIVCCIITPLARIYGIYNIQQLLDDYIVPLSNNFNNSIYGDFVKQIIFLVEVFAICTALTFLCTILMTHIETTILYKIRQDLFAKMEKLPIRYFDTHKHGDIMSVYTNDVSVMQQFLYSSITTFIYDITVTIANFCVMLYYSWKLTLVVCIAISFINFIIRYTTGKTRPLFKKRQDSLGELNGYIEEIIDGQKVVKTFNHESFAKNDFDKENEKLTNISVEADKYANLIVPIMVNISNINQCLIIFLATMMMISGSLSVGITIVFFQYVRSFFYPIGEMAQHFQVVMSALAGAERIFNILDENEEENNGELTIEKSNGNIEFKNVCFKYESGKGTLNNINLKADNGKKIALVGSTGAGKTTITSLLNRFYDISSGEIIFNGVDIRNIDKKSLRRNIAVVLQEPNLFTDNVMENIRYSRFDATDEEVMEVATESNADLFIKRLPQGYKTLLVNSANNLSQGEKQLLTIARAMLSNAPVLVLDEATSSIDTRTEKLIEDGMKKLMKNRTTFIIAHRLSTVRNSDTIIVLENGEIVESGNHNELLNNKNRYYQLYNGLAELG